MSTQLSYDIKVYDAVKQDDGSYLDMFETVLWYNEQGMIHNESGPALITHDGICEWWIDGIQYSFDDWCVKLDKNIDEYASLIINYGTGIESSKVVEYD
jgi:hypothetical protein